MSKASRESNAPKSPGRRSRRRNAYGLASARDRVRLRERNVAERTRVEQMLATAPLADDRRSRLRRPNETREANRPLELGRSASARAMGLARSCPVCGDLQIVTDEVIHGGTLSMSECLHCEHRWTMRPKVRWVDLGTRMNRRHTPAGERENLTVSA